MALSPLRSKSLHHNRSLSLPSKINPATSQLDEALSKSKAFEASCSSLSSMKNRVKSLKNLHSNIGNLLLLPHIQQIISQECQGESVGHVLDGYIGLLDACTTANNLVSNAKQDVQELLSALRRKDVDGIRCYFESRKKLKKVIRRSLKELRSSRSIDLLTSLRKNRETTDLVYKLEDAESVTITMLESLLSYFIGTKMQARQSGWSLVTKLMNSKKVMNYRCDETYLNEFEKMDSFLQMSPQDIRIEELMKLLKGIDSSIQDLEEELQCLFRQLINTRVFLLNILNH